MEKPFVSVMEKLYRFTNNSNVEDISEERIKKLLGEKSYIDQMDGLSQMRPVFIRNNG